MDNPQNLSDDDAERLDDELALFESAEVLAAGSLVPFHPQSFANIKAGFAVSPLSLKALMTMATLARVTGERLETIAATVEVAKGLVRISTGLPLITARASLNVETFFAADTTGDVTFGIKLSQLVRLARCGQPGDELNFALIGDEEGDFLQIKEFRNGVPRHLLLQLSIFASDSPDLLKGERAFSHDIVSASAMSEAIRLCRTARATGGKIPCIISIKDGLATGVGRTTLVQVTNPDLSALPVPIPFSESQKVALALRNMKAAKVYETNAAVIVTDGILELSVSKIACEAPALGNIRERFAEQDVVAGDVQQLKLTHLIAELAKQYATSRSRRDGVGAAKKYIAIVRLEQGSVRFALAKGPLKHDWVALAASIDQEPHSSEWGAIDLMSFTTIWAELIARSKNEPTAITLAHCGKAMRLECADHRLVAYLEYCQIDDERIRNR
ncbi:hypothetical protein [Mesorhizobium sp. CO1-1-9]|uniref:hypothetical protein n=1 Tax=Mesorhizobium sp. CO1-1-9 TaxID=2876630 RepID=UPI001CCF367F|nr:hypothetical protein [Mesorhizobium sp. CO1-1-9]MBZ9694885.1 hypothetical protein [Mesorhizobium sp. CO1-1-9]